MTTRREAPLIALVTPTIYVPRFLDAYLADARAAGHARLFVVVAGDRKTPPDMTSYCADVARRTGYEVVYLDVPGQEDYLRRFPELAHVLPWDCRYLRDTDLAAPDYATGYRHATEALKRAARDDATLDSEGKRFLETYVAGMYAWCATFDRIAAS